MKTLPQIHSKLTFSGHEVLCLTSFLEPIFLLQIIQPLTDLAQQHYHEHEGKPFYPGLVQFLTSGPVVKPF